jgi:hypothetical protein
VFGPVIRQERAQALAEGKAEGEKAGRRQEAVSLLQRLIVTRFGAISTTPTRRLAKLTLPELEDLAVRFVTAKNVNDLFGR